MANPIVITNVTQVQAPTPSKLQKSGAFLSQGGTNTSPGTYSYLASVSSLAALLRVAAAITSLAWSGNTVTVTTAAPHGLTISDALYVTIAGAAPAGYNGVFPVAVTGASTFTYQLIGNPGSETLPGTWAPLSVAELQQMNTTFWSQGSQQGVWILELGPGGPTDGVSFLTGWIAANPGIFYSYFAPRTWDNVPGFLAFLGGFNTATSKTYFWVTTTLATYGQYPTTLKCINLMVETPAYGVWPANALTALTASSVNVNATTTTAHGVLPGEYFTISGCSPAAYNGTFMAQQGTTGTTLLYNALTAPGAETVLGTLVQSQFSSAGIPSTEFSHAADFQVALSYNPSSTTPVAPLNLAYLFDVTPFPTQGNSAVLSALNNGNVSYVGTAAAGGLTNSLLIGGNTADGRPFNYWYSVDWVQVNVDLNVTNYLINRRNSTNPCYYNQQGITDVQGEAVATMNDGISFGLVLNPVKQVQETSSQFQLDLDADAFSGYTVVNAVPFASYTTLNPSNYRDGVYGGLSIVYTPLLGFEQIIFNIAVSDFAT